jgi:hypothetical protein
VPSQDRIGRYNGRDLPQEPAAESSAFRREASALVISQPEAAPFQLPLEDPVLFHQIFDDLLLVAVDPSRERYEQHLQRVEVGSHGRIVP